MQTGQGRHTGTLCDLQRGRIKLIPNDLIDLLSEHDGKTLDEIKAAYGPEHAEVISDYFRFLAENDWGMWTTTPEAFGDLDLGFESPELVSNAIVDMTRESDHDFQTITAELDDLGCRALQLRIFFALPLEELDWILQCMKLSKLRCIEVMIGYDEDVSIDDYKALLVQHQRVSKIIRHSAPQQSVHYPLGEDNQTCMVLDYPLVIDSQHHCGVVAKMYFTTNLFHFAEAMTHNSCLNKKISVDSKGLIRNCPSLPEDYGHHRDISLRDALFADGFRDRWTITKDQISVCRDCEFRYACTDCRAYTENGEALAKPSSCTYNPYTAQWARDPQQQNTAAMAV